jgi:hypothetical protein
LDDAVRAYRRLVDVGGRKRVSRARLKAVVDETVAATRRVQRADRELAERLTTGMSPDERREFLEGYRERGQELEEEAQPSP